MNKVVLVFSFLLWTSISFAAVKWNSASKKTIYIGEESAVMVDSTGKRNAAQVAAEAQKFVAYHKPIFNFKPLAFPHWIKFEVDNNTNDQLIINVAQSLIPVIDCYYQDSVGNWHVQHSGYHIPLSKKVFKNHNQLFIVPPHVKQFYLRYIPCGFPMPVSIHERSSFQDSLNFQHIIFGIFMGIMIFVILYNLFLFVSLQKYGYLHYSILVFLYATFSGIFDGYLIYLFPSMDMEFWYYINPILNQPNGLLYCVLFLEVKKYAPKLYKVSLFLLGYFILYLITYLFMPMGVVLVISQLHALIGISFMATLGIVTGRKGNKLGYVFAFTYILFFVSAVIEVLYDETGSPAYLFNISYISIGILIEAFLLAYLLSKRFDWEKAEMRRARNQAQEELLLKTQENERIVLEQNQLLEQKVDERTAELNTALHDLKASQLQLVQQEKLASLGQLTAGIAHEIKNPLNFIINFSELSRELANDMVVEQDPEERKFLAESIQGNLEKIYRHGMRADSIIKNMLDHSRSKPSEKSLIDINKLAEEYLTLSYQGVKAKTPGFNCEIKMDLDPAITGIVIVGQDIARVLLNIFNNGFYAINQRIKSGDAFKPVLQLQIKQLTKQIEIRISDTGTGIPSDILDKIFNPFFTTKPTGEGTGLGLSLSYDIIKAHGGDLIVESELNKGTTFIIRLPL